MMAYAQEMPYWGTTIKPAKSRAEIDEYLNKHGARVVQITTGRLDGKEAWKITFEYNDKPYQIVFHPLEVKRSYGNPTQANKDQALCQMGRFAFYAIKNLIIIAEQQPAALFGFLALPTPEGIKIAADLGIEGLLDTGKALGFNPDFKKDTETSKFTVKETGEIS